MPNTTQCTAAIIQSGCVMVPSWVIQHSVLRQSFKVGVSWCTRGYLPNTTQCTAAIIQSGCVMVHSWVLAQYNTVYRGNHSKWVCHGALMGNTTQCTMAIIQSGCVMVHLWVLQHSVSQQSFKVGVSWCTRGYYNTAYRGNHSKWVCHGALVGTTTQRTVAIIQSC